MDRLRRRTARRKHPVATLDEARENLKEAVALVLEANRELARRKDESAQADFVEAQTRLP